MYFIGLDQALANTGWCVMELNKRRKKKKVSLIKHGLLKTSPREARVDRIIKIVELTNNLCQEYKPEKVFIEEVFCQSNRGHFWKHLVAVESCLELELTKNKQAFSSISAKLKAENSWRRVLNISKRDKSLSKSTINAKKLSEHEADAICICLGGILIENYVILDEAKYKLEDYLDGIKRDFG